MRAIALVMLAAGCHQAAPTTTPKADPATPVGFAPVSVSCEYLFDELPMYAPPSHQTTAPITAAHETARGHAAAGQEASTAGKRDVAASEFMACARAYAAITDADPERGLAMKTADLCVGNAISAYQMARQLEAVGKVELAKLASEDPRLGPLIEARLGKQPRDCPAR